MAKSISYAVSPSTNIIPRDDTAYDTDFAMYYSLCTDDKLPVTIYNLLTQSKYVKKYNVKYQHYNIYKQSESTTVILW